MDVEHGFVVGGEVGCFSASLAIEGDDLDPDDISVRLACASDMAHRKGQARKKGAPFSSGYWSIEAKASGTERADQLLAELWARLPKDPTIWNDLSSRFSVTLGIGVRFSGNRDIVLSKEIVRAAALLGAALWVDMYCSDDGAEEG